MKVRFNLGAGNNYMKWKVSNEKSVEYLDPNNASLRLVNCKLVNRPKSAKKIHEGAHKFVCAWIECEYMEQIRLNQGTDAQVHYNPRIKPYWYDDAGNNIDNNYFPELITVGKKVYIHEKNN